MLHFPLRSNHTHLFKNRLLRQASASFKAATSFLASHEDQITNSLAFLQIATLTKN